MKPKKRHKARGKCDKVLVIGPFVNEAHLKAYYAILDKYGMTSASDSVEEGIRHERIGESDSERLEILFAEEDNPPEVRIEDIFVT